MRGASSRIAISVAFSGLLPLAAELAGHWYSHAWRGEWSFHSEAFHSSVEAVGGFSVLTLGLVLVFVAEQRKTPHPHIWIASALVAKGIMDLFHASLGPSLPLVWFRCLTTLIGGALFAAVWLPSRFFPLRRLAVLPLAAAAVAIVSSAIALAVSKDSSPIALQDSFTSLSHGINTLGGVSYLAAAVFFLIRYRAAGGIDDLLWLNVSLLFGVSSLLFTPSVFWNYEWWYWHLMRLVASLLCLGYFFGAYTQAEKALRHAHGEITREVAQRRRAEERIQQQNDFLKTVIESLAHPFYVVDVADYTIRIANSAATLDNTSDYATCYSLTHGSDKPCAGLLCPCPLEEVRRTGQPVVAEHNHCDKDGNVTNMEVHAYPIVDTTGTVAQVIEYLLDITERKSHEKERERLIGELAAKNAELERFTYTVSHDLKSPLITIKGFLGYLERDMVSGNVERLRKDTERIHGAVAKMSRLLDELLELSRIGRIANPPQDVPLASLVASAMDTLASRIAERGITVDVPKDLPVLYGDIARLREVVENLLDNAVKFMGDQPYPRVEILIRDDAEKDIVCVKDNGLGIDPRYQVRIFELFERLEQDVEGTGIGLAIVKRIVEVHGGSVWVESEGVGRGSFFCFALPKRQTSGTDLE
jgi:signal transduction histidine kinase